ncbi:MAG TPA: hypothetical protein VIF88_12000 [Methylocystis sp.]|jgi:hypothetical protein
MTLPKGAFELAARINPLMAEIGRLQRNKTDSRKRVSLNDELRRKYAEERNVTKRLAAMFGESRGWRLSEAPFGWRILARGTYSARDWASVQLPPGCDHTYYYRHKGGRVAAIATYPYAPAFERNRAECEAFARKFRLGLEFPDWPSWHFPGETTFVLWTVPETPLTRDELLEIEHRSYQW